LAAGEAGVCGEERETEETGMADTKGTDVIEVVKTQHQEVKRLLSRVAAGAGDSLEESFCELRRMIAVHETAEEEIVYPALRSTGEEGKRVADARTAEEAEGTKVLAKLEGLTPGTAEFSKLFEEFRVAVLHHAESEEAEVFPILRSSQKPEMLQKMAEAFEVAEKAAPTHAHPHSGTSAVSNLIAGPALAIMDHVRDALHKS
jgi:hemerythrin superfamily protein